MAYKVIWSAKAEETFDIVIDYLQAKWTEKQIRNFISKTEQVTGLLAQNPYLFRGSEKENVHEVLVTKKRVELLAFFDTRKDPKRKFFR